MKEFDLEKVEKAFEWLQKEFDDVEVVQSIEALIQKVQLINQAISWAGQQTAIAKYNLNKTKVEGYDQAVANGLMFSPMILKEYISAACAQRNYEFDLIERLSRSMVHISDNLRTCISALKTELQISNYSNNV